MVYLIFFSFYVHSSGDNHSSNQEKRLCQHDLQQNVLGRRLNYKLHLRHLGHMLQRKKALVLERLCRQDVLNRLSAIKFVVSRTTRYG
jgi:hypothetical protein